MHVHATCVQMPLEAGRGSSLGAEVIGTYEMSNVGAKEQQVLCAPEYLFFKTSI